MSSFTFNNQRKEYIQLERGWSPPTWEPLKRKFLNTPGYPGARLLGMETDPRRLSVPVGIIVPDGTDLETLKEEIATWLITEQATELTFDTKLDRTYIAVIDEDFNVDNFMSLGKGTLKFICPMPYKLGPRRKIDFKLQGSRLITNISNNESKYSDPTFIVKVETPSTFIDISRKKEEEIQHFRMGYPVSVEERTVEKEQLVMHDEMKTMVGWNQNGPNTNEGENIGTLKSDSERFVIDNFGAGSTWHGGVARKSLKEPLQDFTVEANEETGEYLTFEKINGGKLYVADADALQRWTEDGSHKYDIYSPQTEDQNMSAERLKQLTEAELKKRINSTVQYEVTPIALEKIFGLSHEKVNKGDIVHFKDTKFTPPLFLEARLIAADECDTNAANDKYYFGDFKEVEDTRSLLDHMYAQVMGSLAGKANKGLLDKLEELVKETNEQVDVVKKESEAAKKLAEKVQENLKNYQTKIIESAKPPTIGLENGKTLWLDISNGKPGILKLWKNGNWESVVPDMDKVKEDTLEQVNKDIETTKTELNKKVQEAQNQATGQFNEVNERC
ncbi:phage tail family protein [Bacillus cereus]|uniref:distal tail protein Dit n=1 Tax=Bacillus cereus TaxID=1396 RepID=UPI002FDBDED7